MGTTLRTLLTACFVFYFVFVSGTYEQKDEGASCSQLGFIGVCKKIKECAIALEAVQRKGYHELKTCGFDGVLEIVCCPDLSDRRPGPIETTTLDGFILPGDGNTIDNTGRLKETRKCEKMCKKIYEDNKIKPEIIFHIFNGEDAKEGQFPHMVALGFENAAGDIEWSCGASLISARFLLSAAHCFVCNGCSDPKKARFGIIDIKDDQSAQDIDVKNTIPHPRYNATSRHNDIAVVELARDVTMSNRTYPACLYTEDNDPLGLQIIGWGQTLGGNRASKAQILQVAVIQAVPVAECNVTVLQRNKYSSKTILDTQICGTTSSDACQGDSGGPLQIQKKEGGYSIVGVVSYGAECGSKVPGIYTRVVKYLDWIEERVWPD